MYTYTGRTLAATVGEEWLADELIIKVFRMVPSTQWLGRGTLIRLALYVKQTLKLA